MQFFADGPILQSNGNYFQSVIYFINHDNHILNFLKEAIT